MAHIPRNNKTAPKKSSHAAEVFERDWKSFKLQKDAFEECDCKKADGRLCSCFMQHAEGRSRFADHCHLRRHLHARRSEVTGKLWEAKRGSFWARLGENRGTCECITDTCSCLYNRLHPKHEGCYATWTQRRSTILKEWEEKLKQYDIAPNHEEFGIRSDIYEEDGFYSKEMDFSDSLGYCPSSPVFTSDATGSN
jgi:hypothetical protein